ncbi:MAG TPA: methyltransferase domain-containing protein [Terriglobia bacterium]|nr:methyltransferase domain-containing protein [Terriglobia bacterium]
MDRHVWAGDTHESAVESFYSAGVENFGDFHGGYLNFGLWENGNTDYLKAAETLVLRIGEMLGIDGSSHVLDVAPGMGPQDVLLYRRFNGPRIEGLDATWKHVERARARARENGIDSRVSFHHGSATAIPFADGTFSHVMSIEGPEHFNTRDRFLKEAWRVLRPGGVMALADYTVPRENLGRFDRGLIGLTCRMWKVPAANIWTTDAYRTKLAEHGFMNIEVTEVGERVIPGYYLEQRRLEVRRELARIRGFVAGRLGQLIDHVLIWTYRRRLVEYVLVRAEKPR